MLRLPLFTGLVVLVLMVDAIDAYGFGFGLDAPDLGGASLASKNGDSAGCTAGGVAKSMFWMSDCLARSSSVVAGSSVCSASGDDTVGACLPDEEADALLASRLGAFPFAPPTVTCFTFAKVELDELFTDGFGERLLPCPGIITCSIFTLPSSSGVTDVCVEPGVSDELLDLTETIRAAPVGRAAVDAGMGCAVASSQKTESVATESRIKDGEIDAIVYRVSLLLLYRVSRLPDLMLDAPDHVLSRKSPGRKNRASPS
jgi:hypothetical protein